MLGEDAVEKGPQSAPCWARVREAVKAAVGLAHAAQGFVILLSSSFFLSSFFLIISLISTRFFCMKLYFILLYCFKKYSILLARPDRRLRKLCFSWT